MGHFVIAAYRPHAGREARLLDLVRKHVSILRGEGLATDRSPLVMRAADGTIIEIFEWASAEAVERAHTNEVVRAMWGEFEEVCEYEILANLAESRRPFPPFEPVEL